LYKNDLTAWTSAQDHFYGAATASQPTPLHVSATNTSDRINHRSLRFTH
jgi:hypothetical protein